MAEHDEPRLWFFLSGRNLEMVTIHERHEYAIPGRFTTAEGIDFLYCFEG